VKAKGRGLLRVDVIPISPFFFLFSPWSNLKEVTGMNDETHTIMACRPGCGACCIAPSITSALPGMPEDKPAGVRCVQLAPDNHCRIHNRPERPAFCASFPAMDEHCGADRDEALVRLGELERLTAHVCEGDDRP
jgi:uncharacterized protein